MLASFAFINDSLAWPGYWAILPVVGAGLIILAQKEHCWLTNNPVAQWLGDRSYSLYLWHWPLVVALYFAGLQSDWAWVVGFFALSLLLAHLSYRFVEVPTRSYLSAASLRKEIFAIGAAGVVISLSAVAVKVVTFEGRVLEEVDLAAFEKNNKNWAVYDCRYRHYSNSYGNCIYQAGELKNITNSDSVDLILIGDSHAQMYASSIARVAEKYNKNLLVLTAPGCSFQFTEDVSLKGCQKANFEAKKIVEQYPKNVPLIVGSSKYFNRFSTLEEYESSYINTVCDYAKERDVFLIRPLPFMDVNPPSFLTRSLIFSKKSYDVKVSKSEYLQRDNAIWKVQDKTVKLCNAKILDVTKYLCDEQDCYASHNSRPLYYDGAHLSEYGNKFLVPMFEQVFQALQ